MTDKERKDIFSRNLLRILNDNGKSQVDVAKAIGVSQQTFNTWCRGVAIPRMGKIQLLADFFKIDMSELISNKTAASSDNTDLVKEEIITNYNLMNEDGQLRLLEQSRFFASQDEYKRIQSSEEYA